MSDILRKIDEILNKQDLLSWFGTSKVGLTPTRPMKLYRGISPTIEERHPSSYLGIFASPNLQTAKSYANGGKVITVYMKIENPYYMEYDEIQNIKNKNDALKISKTLKRKGYDGIFLKPIEGSGSMPNTYTEYIAFEPSQIKEV